MSNALYIIGNGFDLYHKLPTSYQDFRNYCFEVEPQACSFIDMLSVDSSGAWKDFEECLGYTEFAEELFERAYEECGCYLAQADEDHWSDSVWHDFQYEVGIYSTEVQERICDLFCSWINEIENYKINTKKSVRLLDPTATYLCFNYTSTLEKVFGIPHKNIVYIHGCAANPGSIIFGHGSNRPIIEDDLIGSYYKTNELMVLPEDYDFREHEAASEILGIRETFRKNTKLIINNNSKFYNSLNSITKVYVLGHGLGCVDHPYFEEIINRTKSMSPSWVVSYHDRREKKNIRAALTSLGLPRCSLKMKTLSRLL